MRIYVLQVKLSQKNADGHRGHFRLSLLSISLYIVRRPTIWVFIGYVRALRTFPPISKVFYVIIEFVFYAYPPKANFFFYYKVFFVCLLWIFLFPFVSFLCYALSLRALPFISGISVRWIIRLGT